MERLKRSIKSFIKTWKSNSIDSAQIRVELMNFWEKNDLLAYQYVTSVKVYKKKSKVVIKITSHKPSIMIGKDNRKLTSLTNHMKLHFGELLIDVRPSKIWSKK